MRGVLRDGVEDLRVCRVQDRAFNLGPEGPQKLRRLGRELGDGSGISEAGTRGQGNSIQGDSRRGCLLWAEDRHQTGRRARTTLAAEYGTVRLKHELEIRARIHRRRWRKAPARHGASSALRQHRAFLRRVDRALCRGVPALAGSGASWVSTYLGETPGECRGRKGEA